MFSFLFDTFINLYLGLVVSFIRDLNPQYNFMMRVYAYKQLQVQISPRFFSLTLWHKQF